MHMESSDNNGGSFTYGSLVMNPTNISHFEVSIAPISSLSKEGTIEIANVPSNADVLISSPGVEWTVNLITLNSAAVILDAKTLVTPAILQGRVPVIIAGKSKSSLVDVDGLRSKQIFFVSGCLVTENGQRGYSISDWLVWRTLTNYSVSIGNSHTCNVETMNVSSIVIHHCSDVGIGGLTDDTTNQVYITNASTLKLTVDPDVQDSKLMASYGIWAEVRYNGFENGTDRFFAKRTNGKGYTIDVLGADDLSVIRGVTKFEAGSLLDIDCANSKTQTQIDMSNTFSTEVQMHADMNVVSNKCTAKINNMISKNTSMVPSVVLGHGLELELAMTMLPPYDPEGVRLLANSSLLPVRSLMVLANSTINRTRYVLSETSVDNKTTALVDVEWDSALTKDIQNNLQDSARYVLEFDGDIIDSNLVKMNVSSGSMLSFGDLHGSTVLFVSAKTSDFTPEKRKFSLTHSNSSGDYCFDPCQDCTEGAWGRVVISGKICQPRSAQDSCKERAKVTVNITGTLEGVSCGSASFDDERNETCGFAMNDNGRDNGVLTVPESVMVGTTVVIAFSMLLTVIGASSLIARLVFACKEYSTLNIWWTHNTFRDLLTDQFSWAAIVITACLPQVVDIDYAQWGGWVVAIMMRTKTFVLDWFISCSDDGNPVWVTPATIVFWFVTFVTVVLRIVEIILVKREITLSSPIKNTILAIQSVLTVAGFLLMPLVGYSLAFLNSTSYTGFISVLCIILLFLSQPIGEVNRSCITGIVASVLNVLIPVAMCIFVGVGAEFVPLVAMALVCTIVLPIIDMIVLWLAFFRKAAIHSTAWKHSIGWTVSMRVVSMFCGLAFLIMLFFNLSESTSMIAGILWFVWVCLPFFCVIPLTAGVPSVLSASEVVPTRKPLLGNPNSIAAEGSPLLNDTDGSDNEL